MEVKLSQEERLELTHILPFHGEAEYRKIFDDFRVLVGFTEEEISALGTGGEKKFQVGLNLRIKLLAYLEAIKDRTVIQEGLYQKLKP
ncbi:MAG: hypothetical protein WC455_19955 [Dehalococcoidia bacterium]|jgi:hypothetical protein